MKKQEADAEVQEYIRRELENLRLEYEDLFSREREAIEKERLSALERLEDMTVRTLEDVQAERKILHEEVEEEERLLRERMESRMAALLTSFDRAGVVDALFLYAWRRLSLEEAEESLP